MSYDSSIGRFMQEDPAGYIDGSNRYQVELSNPVIGLDPTGLDRYIGGIGHHFIAVDTWAIKRDLAGKPYWVKTGIMRYDFSLSCPTGGAGADEPNPQPIINFIGALTFSASGQVVANPLKTGTSVSGIPSTPEADQRLKDALDVTVINPPNYQVFFYNCNDWVAAWENFGIVETTGKPSLPTFPSK